MAFCQRGETVPSGLRRAAMPQERRRETPGAVVMQIERMPGDGLRETNTQRRAVSHSRAVAISSVTSASPSWSELPPCGPAVANADIEG